MFIYVYIYISMFKYLCLYIYVYPCLSMFIYSFNQVNGDLVPRLALARSQVAGLSGLCRSRCPSQPQKLKLRQFRRNLTQTSTFLWWNVSYGHYYSCAALHKELYTWHIPVFQLWRTDHPWVIAFIALLHCTNIREARAKWTKGLSATAVIMHLLRTINV